MLMRIAAMFCGAIAATHAHELDDAARGLDVSLETPSGDLAFGGIPLILRRATGPGVQQLAERLVRRWREEVSPESVRITSCCGWQIASRLAASESHVLQWQTIPGSGELLWSSMPLDQRPLATRPTAPLIAGCTWTTPIHGRMGDRLYLQASASCALPANQSIDQSLHSLLEAGWNAHRYGTRLVIAQRGLVQLQLVADSTPMPAAKPGASSLVLIETRPAPARLRP